MQIYRMYHKQIKTSLNVSIYSFREDAFIFLMILEIILNESMKEKEIHHFICGIFT